ncbi:helix-turn-helix domain-containing protein [Streptomyces sp. NPDC059627]
MQATASSILVPLRVTAPVDTPFRAVVEAARAGPVALARIRSTPHVVAREARAITSTDPDLFKVTLHRSGPATAEQDGRQHTLSGGDLVVLDTTRPYRLAVPTCDVVVMGLPRAMLGPYADVVARHAGFPLAGESGIRSVIASMLSRLGDLTEDLPDASGIHLADALASLLVAAYADTATAEHAELPTELTDRIIAYTRANLGDPTLCVETVAHAHGISPRHLHQLFHRRGGPTFAAWVRHERLHRIRRDLLDPTLTGRTTAAIAARWGMFDAGHVGRALKAEYGQTAAELRRTAGTAH